MFNTKISNLVSQIKVFDTLNKKELKKDLEDGLEVDEIARKNNISINETEKEKLAKILQNIPKDKNYNVYEPNAIKKALQGIDKDKEGFLYASLELELTNSLILYENTNDYLAFQKLKDLKNNTESNSVYNRIFRQNNIEFKKLLKEYEFIYLKVDSELDFVGLGCSSGGYCDKVADLLAREDLSLDEFKKEFIKLSENTKNEFDEQITSYVKNQEKHFKPIEAKSDYLRESMEDILNKINKQKIKDERDLLALFLAYKDGENLYDKRV